MNSHVGMCSSSLPWNLESHILGLRKWKKKWRFSASEWNFSVGGVCSDGFALPRVGRPSWAAFCHKSHKILVSVKVNYAADQPCFTATDVEAGGLSLKIPKGKRMTGPAHVWQIAVTGLGITVLEQVKPFMLQCPTRILCLVCHYPIPVVLQWDIREENRCEGMMESCGAP